VGSKICIRERDGDVQVDTRWFELCAQQLLVIGLVCVVVEMCVDMPDVEALLLDIVDHRWVVCAND